MADEDLLKINYFSKIPDIIELPITVVNNVLYANWKPARGEELFE
jgi:hypothetical protein